MEIQVVDAAVYSSANKDGKAKCEHAFQSHGIKLNLKHVAEFIVYECCVLMCC
jgi:hypothetical protein